MFLNRWCGSTGFIVGWVLDSGCLSHLRSNVLADRQLGEEASNLRNIVWKLMMFSSSVKFRDNANMVENELVFCS